MARTYEFTIGPAETGLRLDQFLSRRLPEFISRTLIQRIIRSGRVTINGAAEKVSYKLRNADKVTAAVEQIPPKPGDVPLVAQAIQLDIAYEDEHVLVVNKPAGLVTHPAPGHWDGTLVNAVLWHLEQSGPKGADGKPLARAGIIHRLDKDTSGLLMVAKSPEAQLVLSRSMKARTIHRSYLAVVEGSVPTDNGTVTASLARHAVHRKRMAVRHLGGRHAVTHYAVLRRFSRKAMAGRVPEALLPCTLLRLELDTGRTHQIRVHMAHLGYPVLGDIVYGARPPAFWQKHGVGRQLLHAFQLALKHPFTGLPLKIQAAPPADFLPWCGSDIPL